MSESNDEVVELRAEIDRLKSERKDLAAQVKTLSAEGKSRDSIVAERDRLASEVADLSDKLKETRGEMRDRRHDVKRIEEERDQFALELTTITAERDDLKTRIESDPENHKTTIAELTGKLRGITHRQAFEATAAAHGVTDKTKLADLYALSGYTPSSDEIDQTALADTITASLASRPWLKDEPKAAAAASGDAATAAAAQTAAAHAAQAQTAAPGGATTAPGGAGGNGAAKVQVPGRVVSTGAGASNGAAAHAAAAQAGPGADRGQSLASETQTQPRTKPVGAL